MGEQYSRFCPHINRPAAVCSVMQMQNRLCTLCCKEHYANPEQYSRCFYNKQPTQKQTLQPLGSELK
ncbi:hypothetical protein [Candidatus Bathycorpusculum sp.]|uniref:hypothetical protein n=1 Tax=Candidatus Bathycorpusculum sp. TaxID=2994959 RepID=UPI0028373D8B|nr:hypothetical protein [Candidatus Termitimicrobium sp.]MCL2432694.1 hypothetical protein [Candidatus Termitimicrobium sp.]